MSTPAKGRSGGVLPINPAVTRKPTAVQKPSSRSPAPRLRLIVRRLPPGLTESEFWEGLGTDWQTSKGKVDWFAFKPGKISKDPSKPSRPGRAYLKVKDQSLLEVLSARVKQTQFKDAKNSGADPCLVGLPSLEFAPYNKVPGSRARNDGRQGTIDQDQEFIDFLQSLTEPITKSTASGPEGGEAKAEKVTTTPLIQFIKDKKANKAKDKEAAAAAKGSKKQESKEPKAKAETKATVIVKSNTSAAEKARVAKATQDAVKAINKSVASMQTKTPASKPELKTKEKEKEKDTAPVQASAPKRERERGSASAAARMISRDLGLAPKEPRTPRAPRNASSATSTSTTTVHSKPDPAPATANSASVSTTPAATPPTPVPTSTAPPTGPRSTRTSTPQQSKQVQATPQRQAKAVPQPSPGAKSAFLKHANPSQGVTEELLRTTFATYGEITRCEIDKKKGLGYIDFTDTESLKKAMAASPVKIGNGQVVVLENRSPYRKGVTQQRVGDSTSTVPAAQSAAASAASSPQVTTASIVYPAIIASVPSTAVPADTPVTIESSSSNAAFASATQDVSTPTAPRGGRAGQGAGRGARGTPNFTANRGAGANRGARANNNRGGRGARGPRGAATTGTPVVASAQAASLTAPASQPTNES